MKFINLESFGQLPPNQELSGNSYSSNTFKALLKEYGASIISDLYTNSSISSVQNSSMNVYGVTRSGLVMTSNAAAIGFVISLPDVKQAALQLGFRYTLSEGAKYNSDPRHISIGGYSFTTPYPTEAASYYYELFAAWDGSRVNAELFCNGSSVGKQTFTVSDTTNIKVIIGQSSNYIFQSGVTGKVMLGDIYLAEIPYVENVATAAPFGSVEVKYSKVVGFNGGNADNSVTDDIVSGLNGAGTADGFLLLGADEEAAVATFENIDNTDGKLLGAVAGVVYRSSVTTKNYLAWGLSCGEDAAEIQEDKKVYQDQSSWTTVRRTLMKGDKLGGTGLTFKASLYNRKNLSK